MTIPRAAEPGPPDAAWRRRRDRPDDLRVLHARPVRDLRAAGADFVLLDMEHCGVGMDTDPPQLAAARGHRRRALRARAGDRLHLIAPVLDAGAFGIMVPLSEDRSRPRRSPMPAAIAPKAAAASASRSRMTITPPARCRPRSGRQRAHAGHRADRIRTRHRQRRRDPGGARHRCRWLGHYDLTDSMGIAGDFEHPDFHAARRLRLHRHGRRAVLATSVAQTLAWRQRGFRCLGYGTDVGLFRDALAQGIAPSARSRQNNRRIRPRRGGSPPRSSKSREEAQ